MYSLSLLHTMHAYVVPIMPTYIHLSQAVFQLLLYHSRGFGGSPTAWPNSLITRLSTTWGRFWLVILSWTLVELSWVTPSCLNSSFQFPCNLFVEQRATYFVVCVVYNGVYNANIQPNTKVRVSLWFTTNWGGGSIMSFHYTPCDHSLCKIHISWWVGKSRAPKAR